MPKEVMLWNISSTASVRASRLRNFVITKYKHRRYWTLLGWYDNNGNSMASSNFDFGEFITKEQAQGYLLELHRQIETGE